MQRVASPNGHLQVLETNRDITERKAGRGPGEIRRRTQRSNAELDQFAYSASHDLKTPLRAVHNLAQWLNEGRGPAFAAGVCGTLAAHAGNGASRMDRLLDDLLAYSRVGRIQHEPVVVDSRRLVEEIIELLAPLLGLPSGSGTGRARRRRGRPWSKSWT